MFRRVSLAALGGLLALAVSPAPAQTIEEACSAATDVEAGDWAAFRMEGMEEQAGQVTAMRLAVVGEEGDDLWYEFSAETNRGPMIVQLLVPAFPFEPADIKGMVMKAAGQPAMKVSEQMLGMMRGQMAQNSGMVMDFAEKCLAAEVVGTEEVAVPAGTFSALHIRNLQEAGGEGWVSSEVPFGIVKAMGPQGETMLLTEYGDDATSSITEEPQEMGMGMPQP